jgi:acetyl esterase/lipase
VNLQLFKTIRLTPRLSCRYEIGAAKFRALQDEGKIGWPLRPKLERAKNIFIRSREAGREIKCRLLEPQNKASEGVFLHIHGGGFVLNHADDNDDWLAMIADTTSLTVVSIEYRLAPEEPFPAGPEDCYDVAIHLVDNSLSAHSGPVK